MDGEPREVLNVLPRQGVCLCSGRCCWQCLLPLLAEEPPVMNRLAELGLAYVVMTMVMMTYDVNDNPRKAINYTQVIMVHCTYRDVINMM